MDLESHVYKKPLIHIRTPKLTTQNVHESDGRYKECCRKEDDHNPAGVFDLSFRKQVSRTYIDQYASGNADQEAEDLVTGDR